MLTDLHQSNWSACEHQSLQIKARKEDIDTLVHLVSHVKFATQILLILLMQCIYLPQDICFGNLAVFEDKLTGTRAPNAQFVQLGTG